MGINIYEDGARGEKTVRELLRARGWSTYPSPGSRGPSDITAIKDAQKWCIQVKVRRSFEGRLLSTADEARLLEHSVVCECIPVLAVISEGVDLLRVSSNMWDPCDQSVIRDISGRFVAVALGKRQFLLLYNLRTGRSVDL